MRGTPEARFMAKVDKDGPVPARRSDLGPCWLWTGGAGAKGYGRFSMASGVTEYAHRAAHLLFVGPIATGWDVDHLCFVRRCVRPSHLEAVTPAENKLRALPWLQRPLVHGTSAAYTHHGCRCTDCRRANAERHATNSRRRRQRLATADVAHGRATTYSNWLCRCEPCTEAWRDRCVEYRRRKAEQNREAA